MDWKKEYRLSDLFRRRTTSKSPEAPPEPAGTGHVPSEPEPVATEATMGAVPQQVVWKKEVKVSDLFARRKASKSAEAPPEPAGVRDAQPGLEPGATKAPVRAAAPKSVWRKEMKVSDLLRRRKQQPAEPAFAEVFAEAVDAEPALDVPSPDGGAGDARPDELPEPEPASDSEVAADEPSTGPSSEEPPVEGSPEEPPVEEAGPETPVEEAVSDKPVEEPVAEEPAPTELEPTEPEPELTQDAPVPVSIWKKKVRLAPRGGRRQDKPLGSEKPSRAATRAARSEARGGSGARPLPDVPLFRALNLLPREEAKVRTKRPVLQYAGVALLAVLALGGLGYFYLDERSKIEDQQGALEDLKAQIAAVQTAGLPTPAEGVQLAEEAMARVGSLQAALDGRIVWDRVLRDLSLTLPEGVWFKSLVSAAPARRVAPEDVAAALSAPPTVTVSGYALSQEGVAQLVSRLGVLPDFSGVQLQSATTVPIGDQEVVEFAVIAALGLPAQAPSPTTPASSAEVTTP